MLERSDSETAESLREAKTKIIQEDTKIVSNLDHAKIEKRSSCSFSLIHSPEIHRKQEYMEHFNEEKLPKDNQECLSTKSGKIELSTTGCSKDGLSGHDINAHMIESSVVPLATAELVASTDPVAEMDLVISTIECANWHQVYQAIESARRLIVFHPDAIKEHFSLILPHILKACDNLRSAMAKNALFAVGDIIQHAPISSYIDNIDSILSIFLRRTASEKKFLSDTASENLIILASNGSLKETVQLIHKSLLYGRNKTSKIVSSAALFIMKCLSSMLKVASKDKQITHCVFESEEEEISILMGLIPFLEAKETVARTNARACLRLLGRLYGIEKLKEYIVKSNINELMKNEMIEESQKKSSGPKQRRATSNFTRQPSLRDRIKQERRKQGSFKDLDGNISKASLNVKIVSNRRHTICSPKSGEAQIESNDDEK